LILIAILTNLVWLLARLSILKNPPSLKKMRKLFLSILLVSLGSVQVSLAAFPEDLDDVVFIEEGALPGIGALVRAMAVTANLTVDISGSHTYAGQNVVLSSSKSSSWPVGGGNLGCCNSNAWLFAKIGETWYAGTWEYMRKGQTTKSSAAVVGPGHLRFAPLNTFSMQTGETYGFMLAGITRAGLSRINIRERSNVAFFKFNVGPVDASEIGSPPPEESLPNLAPITSLLLEEESVEMTPPPEEL
jgi:hypothetical protein